jgi:two-component system, cell cycle response regulator DivK
MLLKGKRIFYVEDDVKNRAIVQMMLEREGAIISFERWGRSDEALARLQEFLPIDLILLDLMFPRGISGYDVYAALRQQPALGNIPVAAISASDPTIEIPRARQLGFAGFISKPISLHTFAKTIVTILNGEAVWA